MRLRDLSLKSVYNSEKDNLLRDFYIPALSCSTSYSRAVGFFSASTLSYAAQGLSAFVQNQGRMRLIIGAELEAEEHKEDSLLVAIMRDGQIFFGTDKVSADQLTAKVKDRLANKVDKRVFIKADARAKYGAVVDVVDNVRSAGVDDVGLLTEQRQTGAAGKKPPTTGTSTGAGAQ